MTSTRQALNLAVGLKPEIKAQIEALPCFKGVTTQRLCQIAEGLLLRKCEVKCRITAMLVIVGIKPLTDESLHLQPTVAELRIGATA